MWNREIRICSGPRSHKNKETTDWWREERKQHTRRAGNRVRNQIIKEKTGGKGKCKVKRGDKKMQRRECEEMRRVCTAFSSWSSECKVGVTAEEERRGRKRWEERKENKNVVGNIRAVEEERKLRNG